MFEYLKDYLAQLKVDRRRKKNFKFGEKWEEEVREHFFIPGWYDIVEKTHNYKQNKKDYVKSSLNPDYKFMCSRTKKNFYVECKARDITSLLKKTLDYFEEYERLESIDKRKAEKFDKDNKYLQLLDICSKEQFLRFKKLNETTKVLFMVLLTSDHSIRDDVFSLIPIDDLLSHKVFYSQLLSYKIAGCEIEPPRLWRNFLLFYGREAFCIRCKKEIKYNNFNPFCYKCWEDWYRSESFLNEERFCHACGKEYKTVSVKPLCFECYKKFPLNIGL